MKEKLWEKKVRIQIILIGDRASARKATAPRFSHRVRGESSGIGD
jgi:hypothetical protein